MKKLLTASILGLFLLTLLPAGFSFAQSGTGCTSTPPPGRMTFSPASGNVYLNTAGNFTIDVLVDPAGCNSGAADVTVKFDTTKLDFVPAESLFPESGAGKENPASYYPNTFVYPISLDAPGVVRMSRAVPAASNPVYTTASGKFVRLAFRPKPPTAVGSQVTFDFNYIAGDTADFTTIASTGGIDLLGGAPSATLTIAQAASAMTITSVTPSSGDKNLAQSITIVGTGFGTTQGTVQFGTSYMGAVTAWTNTSITVTNPTRPSITANTPVDVIVTKGTETATKTNGYTYTVGTGGMTITSVTPSSGDKSLAQSVVIVGTGFGSTQGSVQFGAGYNGAITAWTDTQITVTNPTWPTLTVTTPVNVIVTAGSNSATKTAGYTYTVTCDNPSGCGPYVPPVNPNGTDPYISSIRPTSGNKDISPEVEIFGGNFGSFDPAKSSVAIGIKGATIIDWSANRIVAQFPAEPGLTKRSTRTITMTRASDSKQASYTGFTYTTGPLPSSGPEIWAWLALVLVSLGLAGFTYRKLSLRAIV